MVFSREQKRRELLRKLGLESLEGVTGNIDIFKGQALACLKTETGYMLVSPPSANNKKYHARTSGWPCGQRSLGGFEAAEEAAWTVALWIFGIVPTPPTPSRVKERNARGMGKRKPDRCNHGKGGPDLRTSAYRPKKVKRTLLEITQAGRSYVETPVMPAFTAVWPLEEEISAMQLHV